MIKEILTDVEQKMKKAIDFTKEDLTTIRTGRANPGMFNKVLVEYYGTPTPITQMASITTPEPRLLVVKPYEQSQFATIENAIRNSDLGVNPTNDGNVIRVAIPQLTTERRNELAKQAKSKGEEAKIALRGVRRKAMESLSNIQKQGEAGEDEVQRAEKDLDKITAHYVSQVDELVKHKETELLES